MTDRAQDARLDRELKRIREDEVREKTRKQQLLEAFRDAGRRGLTGLEMQGIVGAFWRLRLRELCQDGYVFLEHPSRVRRGDGTVPTFRWSLVTEPAPEQQEPAEAPLLEPAPPPPGNAIFGDQSW